MRCDQRHDTAELVSRVLGPVPMGVVLGLAVGIDSGRGLMAGAGWGLLSVFCAAVLPALATTPLRRREDRTPRIRLAYMAPALAGAAVGLIVLCLLPAPMEVRVLAVGFTAGLVCSGVVNAFFPSSNHVAALAGGVVLAWALVSIWTLLFVPAVALLCWSRVQLGAHTWPQALSGLLVGLASSALVVLVAF